MGISVVIPAYNAARTISATIESVLAQDEKPHEIIVVDDGSTDDTVAIASAYPGVTVFRQRNQGAGAARALGTLEAKSPYVAYLDADDWFLEGWLKRAGEIIASDDVHFLFADLKRGEPGSAESTWSTKNSNNFHWFTAYSLCGKAIPGNHPVMRFEYPDGWEMFLRGFPLYPSTLVVRRSSVLKCGNWSGEFRRGEDFDFALRMSSRCPVHFLDRVVTVLGLHEVNRDKSGYILLQSRWDVKVLTAQLRDASVAEAPRLKQALATRYCQLGWQLKQAGLIRESREAYWSALRYGRRWHAGVRWLSTFKPRREAAGGAGELGVE